MITRSESMNENASVRKPLDRRAIVASFTALALVVSPLASYAAVPAGKRRVLMVRAQKAADVPSIVLTKTEGYLDTLMASVLRTRDGNWKLRDSFGATELAGKTLLLLGFGRIGREVAKRAQAFGMTVLAYDPYVREAAMYAARVQPAPKLEDALPQADFISVHLPLTPETRGIIGARQFAAMKRTAIVISTARGGLVDEAALVEALRSGTIRAAGLDVFVDEPPSSDNPLLKLDNLLLSPHSAGLTAECAMRMGEVSARNALAGLNGTLDPELVVNKHVLKRS